MTQIMEGEGFWQSTNWKRSSQIWRLWSAH